MHLNAAINAMPTDESTYRLRVQNDVYVLADQILRPGGILHIVDRTHRSDEDARRTTLESHREQAGPTTLDVLEVLYRDCRDAHTEEGIAMVAAHRGAIGGPGPDSPYLLSAIIAKKPG